MLEAHNTPKSDRGRPRKFNNSEILEHTSVIKDLNMCIINLLKLPTGWRKNIQENLIEMELGTLITQAAHQIPV